MMIKRIFCLWCLVSGLCWSVLAQDDPILMRIDGKDVLRSEFEYAYGRYVQNTDGQRTALTVNDFLPQFVDYRLKVAAAVVAGMDTTAFFKEQVDWYYKVLAGKILGYEAIQDSLKRLCHEQKTDKQRLERILVSQIYRYLPQNISTLALKQVEHQMDSLYSALQCAGAEGDFAGCVRDYSDEKEARWISVLQMPKEFEERVWNLRPGEISSPFFTPQGIHIVAVLDRKPMPSWQEMRDAAVHWPEQSPQTDKAVALLVARLKQEKNYVPRQAAIRELMQEGTTAHVLFTLSGKSYAGKDFSRFAAAYPAGINRQFEAFVTKTVLDCGYLCVGVEHPDFKRQLRMYSDSLLCLAISNREISQQDDEAGLQAFFEAHKSDYHWDELLYKGAVLHCTAKRMARRVRKFLKQLPEKEWQDAIRLTVNAVDSASVQIVQGVFTQGENPFVDEKVFKGEKAEPLPGYPVTLLMGCKVKGSDDYRKVRGQLVRDYRQHLERHWMKELHAQSKVEINQEVLKTVNKH